MISRPLSDTLKKDYFQWPEFVLQAFYQLREAMAQAPMLAMSDISKPFVVKTYASGIGIGAVLEQKNYPIAFISQAFGPRAKALSVYERELLAITFAVLNGGIVWSKAFSSLKQTMRVLSIVRILYGKGAENKAADALSRISEAPTSIVMAVTSYIRPLWMQQ